MGKQRFSFIPAAAIRDKNLSKSAKLVMSALGIHANDREEWIFPSQNTLGEMVGLSRRTVVTAISELVSAGYLLKRARFDEETGAQKSSEYFIVFDHPTEGGCEVEEGGCEEEDTGGCEAHFTHNVPILNDNIEGGGEDDLENVYQNARARIGLADFPNQQHLAFIAKELKAQNLDEDPAIVAGDFEAWAVSRGKMMTGLVGDLRGYISKRGRILPRDGPSKAPWERKQDEENQRMQDIVNGL